MLRTVHVASAARTVQFADSHTEAHDTCGHGCSVPLRDGGDVYVCRHSGRIHICDAQHSTCHTEERDGYATCAVSGASWRATLEDPISDMYARLAPTGKEKPETSTSINKRNATGLAATYERTRVVRTRFKGDRTDVRRMLREHDPLGAHVQAEVGMPAGEDEDAIADERQAGVDRRRVLKLRHRQLMLTDINRQLLARGAPDKTVHEWEIAREKLESTKTKRKWTLMTRAYVAAAARAGAQVPALDLMVSLAETRRIVAERDAARSALSESDIDLMDQILRARCKLLWPIFAEQRRKHLNKRRADAGKTGESLDLHLSPTTFNHAFHCLWTAWRSASGVIERSAADATPRWLMAPVPHLDLVLPSERDVRYIKLANHQRVISKAFTKVQGVMHEWLAHAVHSGAADVPLIRTQFATLDEYRALLPKQSGDA